ncbi:glyoxylate/hydroxypyruvate reductase A [Chimaeribacter coloradensis]|uniref:Glyoxylate/hydroxypyruvate reductase A n=1 Tax=Chimaeribacter coloradensis TaxID=2060068 RepID=A0A2N5E7K4_9GAMM|nr:glyoxylate/hydroxypyruvate reductase A [Chimaeribacter coloradensis]PLR37462.1 glyoxylate/hydroxypyruvate reductase A [Chimaeribacter coloradensis]
MNIVYKSDPERGRRWAALFAELAPEAQFRLWPEVGDPETVDYLIAWQPPDNLMQRFPNLKVLFSVGAGADQFDYAGLPPGLPVVRMIEPGLTQGMVEYVTFAVLGLHRDMPRYLHQQQCGEWQPHPVMPAARRRIGVMGLGQLGEASLAALTALGFSCHGWSRTPRDLPGVRCWAGQAELPDFLAASDILVCLLPLTAETRGLLNRDLFSGLPHGAALVQAGRGPQLNQPDLLAALETGQIRAAVLDVTDPEPLPSDHPFWAHPSIWLTPHIASQTQPESAVASLLENVRRFERGEPMTGVVDRQRGY